MPDEDIEASEELRQIEEDRHSFRQRTQLNDRFVYAILAATYFMGFGGQYFLTIVFPDFAMKSGIAVAIVGSLALFIIFSHSYKQYKGIRGNASKKPTYFGIAWLIGLIVTLSATVLISARLPVTEVMHFAYAASCMLIGIIYACSGIFLTTRKELLLGCWLIGVGVVSSILSMPLMLLAIGVLAALGFATCAIVSNGQVSRAL
ncbi:hypothetical protein G7067_00195 [Leucobacter insecticola]|uniref:Uncharacterized protein n=1 Tax=Leucobacter insecticola TaxID=2714934 RepID=A0A6G8FG20_9MICO|nr:hypothetical protein [Leucobacter insecticola]QIM15189.1 hypothetical protein G7067_00195 [Leucobacter insecticola]